jgi:SAM-dependent methyltransferase
MDTHNIKSEVRKHYAAIASGAGSCCSPAVESCCGSPASSGSCCSSDSAAGSVLIRYEDVGLAAEPGAELGLGCGFPTLSAQIREGERVLDLGSGAGVDVFLAAKAVGPQGWVIGVDMTPEMIARAWDNAVKGGYRNVEFRLGDIEALPLPADHVDVVLSNCVINLTSDKRQVFAEIFRVLKPGGRFSISDIVSLGNVPEAVRKDAELWAGCVAGALDREVYLGLIREAGFADVRVSKSVEYGDQQSGDQGSQGFGLASITVEGCKPA